MNVFPEVKPVNPAHFYQTGIKDAGRKDDRSRTDSARGPESGHWVIQLIQLWQNKECVCSV